MKNSKVFNALWQITLILVASALVSGALWQFNQSEASNSFGRGGSDERRGGEQHGEDDHEHGGFSERQERGNRNSMDLTAVGHFAEPAIKLVVVISLVVFGQKVWKRVRSGQRDEDIVRSET